MKIAVVSPHLDDAVFSVGGLAHRWATDGNDVVVITVFAGTLRDRPLSEWERLCGFRSARQAVETRRAEDLRACRRIGASTIWLDHPDHSEVESGSERDLDWCATELSGHLAGAAVVLVPGSPLRNPDHAAVAEMITRLAPSDRRLVHYAEQPYLATDRRRAPGPPEPVGPGGDAAPVWQRVPLGRIDAWHKSRAARQYRSQIRPQVDDVRNQRRYERAVRAEWLAPVSPSLLAATVGRP